MKKEEVLKRLAVIETEVQKLRAIVNQNDGEKSKEMSDFLFKMINNSRMKIHQNSVIYYKDNEWILERDLKNKYLSVRNMLIWSVFKTKYGLNNVEIQDFIKSWVETNLNWRGLTPWYASRCR